MIRNAREDPEWADVERRTLSIAGRAISTIIHTSGSNDLLRIYFVTQRDGVDYNLAYIGSDFSAPHTGDFDKAYMNALFDYGYQQARHGYARGRRGRCCGPAAIVSMSLRQLQDRS